MTWLLVLTMGFPGGEPIQQPVGLMIDEQVCIIAGAGMAAVLEQANPGLDVLWTCLPQGEGVA